LERLVEDRKLRIRLGEAARKRAVEKFSVTKQVDQLVDLWTEILSEGRKTPIFVSDPFGAAVDPALPTLPSALDPAEAAAQLKRRLPRLSGKDGKLRLKAIHVIRHKPGRRCVVRYDVRIQLPGQPDEPTAIIGKVRARRFGKEGYRVLSKLWEAGFDSASADGISVPEPIGMIPKFQMWFQRTVPGQTATRLLPGPDGVELGRRVAEAIHKLHRANLQTERRHGMAEELRILEECLTQLKVRTPEWSSRLERVLAACRHLGAGIREPTVCGIHRDFYPAQVIVNDSRLWLIDFDLYCVGDPALDPGNFIGHMMEQALREMGSASAMSKQQQALEDRFVELEGESCRTPVQAYTTLTLVRHIYLSAQFSDRRPFTAALLDLCEQRLGCY